MQHFGAAIEMCISGSIFGIEHTELALTRGFGFGKFARSEEFMEALPQHTGAVVVDRGS